MAKIVVTGGSGKAGRACVKDLLAHGYEVVNVDQAVPREQPCPTILADLTDFGATLDALATGDPVAHGVSGVVHLAAIPTPRQYTNAVTLSKNVASTYNVFEASRRLGIKNIVWSSSETVQGLPFDQPPPYAPLDEEYAGRPESAYSLSKLLGEEMAKQFCRWDGELKIFGLRFSNVMEPHDYAAFAGFEKDAMLRKWNLWGYIDARDAAQAVRKALVSKLKGAEIFIIANVETVMTRSSAALMAEVFPTVEVRKTLRGTETLLSIEKARRMLGYEPAFAWTDRKNWA